MKILLIIDTQKGFLNKYTVDTKEKIDLLMDDSFKLFDYKNIVATKFFNDENSLFRKNLKWNKMSFHDDDTNLIPTVAEKHTQIFAKSTYSIGEDCLNYIKELKKNYHDKTGMNDFSVDIIGFDTEACILSTCYKLFDNNIDFTVIDELCGSSSGANYHELGIQIIKQSFGKQSVEQLVAV